MASWIWLSVICLQMHTYMTGHLRFVGPYLNANANDCQCGDYLSAESRKKNRPRGPSWTPGPRGRVGEARNSGTIGDSLRTLFMDSVVFQKFPRSGLRDEIFSLRMPS